MLELGHLQAEMYTWSKRNFGDQPTMNPALGVVEEVGELAHAVLKMRQGIRGTKQEHREAIKDAIGDIMIYLCDTASRAGVTLEWPTENVIVDPGDRDKALFHALGVLAEVSGILLSQAARRPSFNGHANPNGDARAPYFKRVISAVVLVCLYLEMPPLPSVVHETWEVVKQRDWTNNKQNGVN